MIGTDVTGNVALGNGQGGGTGSSDEEAFHRHVDLDDDLE